MESIVKTYAAFAIRHDLRVTTDYRVRHILAERSGFNPRNFSWEVAKTMYEMMGGTW